MLTTDQKRNWAHEDGLRTFLDQLKILDQEYHQNLMRSFFWYSEAIKEVGVDHELFFIKMVSSVEALLKFFPKNEDKLEGKMIKMITDKKFEITEGNEIKNWLENRKINQRFVAFLKNYSVGFCKGGKRKASHCYIKKVEVGDYAKRIYTARSIYLHSGKPMYLSHDMNMKEANFWDLDPTMGMMADRKKFSYKEKLPRTRWFERLVNFCLRKFIEEKLI